MAILGGALYAPEKFLLYIYILMIDYPAMQPFRSLLIGPTGWTTSLCFSLWRCAAAIVVWLLDLNTVSLLVLRYYLGDIVYIFRFPKLC